MDLTREVLEIVEGRLDDLSISFRTLSPEELLSRFGRRRTFVRAESFELKLDEAPRALTVTVLDQEEADDYVPVRAVSEEVGRLHESGRRVAYHQVIVAPLGTILLDLVREDGNGGLDESDGRFLAELLDHAAVLPLLARAPEQAED
ncbi:MAG TPA: hypothetical protein VGK69_09145 [Gaiellaceae bacterium]